MEKRSPKTDVSFFFFLFCSPFDVENSSHKMFLNSRILHISHRHTSLTHDTKSKHHSLICHKTTSVLFKIILATRMVLSAQELYAIAKMAVAGMGNRKIVTTLGLPQSTTKRRLCRSKTQRKNTSLTRHLTLHGTLHRQSQHHKTQTTPPVPKWAPTDPQMGPEPILASRKP